MHLQSLVLSNDPEALRILRATLEKFSIEIATCQPADSLAKISQHRFDAVIVDCDDLEDGLQVLQTLRQSSSNKSSVAFALLNGTTTQKAFHCGASFVLQKPLTISNATRCFSAALGLMQRERRRYFRHPISFNAVLEFSHRKQKVIATNISEGGMAISFDTPLPDEKSLQVTFTLPDNATSISTKAEIAWSADLHVGLRFVQIPEKAHERLLEWLNEQILNPSK